MNVEEVFGPHKPIDSDSNDSEYLPMPPHHAHDDEASVSVFSIDDSDVEPHVIVSYAPPQVTPAVVSSHQSLLRYLEC